jgi:hypothetical protein
MVFWATWIQFTNSYPYILRFITVLSYHLQLGLLSGLFFLRFLTAFWESCSSSHAYYMWRPSQSLLFCIVLTYQALVSRQTTYLKTSTTHNCWENFLCRPINNITNVQFVHIFHTLSWKLGILNAISCSKQVLCICYGLIKTQKELQRVAIKGIYFHLTAITTMLIKSRQIRLAAYSKHRRDEKCVHNFGRETWRLKYY